MRRVVAIAILGVSSIGWLCGCQRSGGKVSRYTDYQYGFQVNAPALPMAAPGAQVLRVVMGGPPQDRFASNVNVIVGLAPTSRKEYRDGTVRRLRASGFTLYSERNLTVSERDAVLFDYEGRMTERSYRFLELAVFDKDRFYSVTCTTLSNRFDQDQAALRTCIDSFRLTD